MIKMIAFFQISEGNLERKSLLSELNKKTESKRVLMLQVIEFNNLHDR